jgi:hypothetical protein
MWRLWGIYLNLWYGKYSLAKSFWLFFILGYFVALLLGMVASLLFILLGTRPVAASVFQVIFLGYLITAAVGVWRSANALIGMKGGRPSITYADSAKILGAKTFVVLWLATNIFSAFHLKF